MNRSVNEGYAYNKQKDMLPLVGLLNESLEKDEFLSIFNVCDANFNGSWFVISSIFFCCSGLIIDFSICGCLLSCKTYFSVFLLYD